MNAPQPAERRPGRARRIALWSVVGLFAYVALEALVVPAPKQPSAAVLVGAIRVYQAVLSPLVGTVVRCKFHPSCSEYGALALKRHGTVAGTVKTAGRLWRCSPWGPPPGEDLP
jgi:putative membrane protein insertion efficiency factor